MTDEDKRCLICKRSVPAEEHCFCATRERDSGIVCPPCTSLVRRGNTDALRRLAESSTVW